ncbi:MAG: Glycine betaine ABC transport system, glycine betaine-binding protein OpuAC, partial [uncultured Frankineae bacterium]
DPSPCPPKAPPLAHPAAARPPARRCPDGGARRRPGRLRRHHHRVRRQWLRARRRQRVRAARPGRQPVGGLRGQRRGRRRGRRDRAGLPGHEEGPQGGGLLAGLRHRRGRRHRRELGARGPQGAVRRGAEDRRRGRADRRHGDHRMVGAAVAGAQAPRHHRLAEPQPLRPDVPDLGVGRQGPAARRRPLLRHQRRGAGEEPRTGLRGGLRRQRGSADHRLPQGGGRADAADRLLLRAAVVHVGGAAGEGGPAAAHRGLRRRAREGRLRLPGVRARQDHGPGVRRVGQPGGRADPQLPVDQRRPERRRPLHRRGQDVARGRREEVDRGQPREGAGLAAL